MKLPRSDALIRWMEKSGRGLESVFATSKPRETYSHILNFGLIDCRESLPGDLGRATESWQRAMEAAILARPELLHAAREALLGILVSRHPLGLPGSDSSESGPAGRIHLRITSLGLRFHLAWHDLVWALLVGLSREPHGLPPELEGLPPPSSIQPFSLERIHEKALLVNSPQPTEAGDILYRHFLLDRTVALFLWVAAAGPGHFLVKYEETIDILAGWFQASPLTRLEHLDRLGQHRLFRKDDWSGLENLLSFTVMDTPSLMGRMLMELELDGEPLSSGWVKLAMTILRHAAGSSPGTSTASAAFWKALVRSYAPRGGLEQACQQINSRGKHFNRLRPLVNLASTLLNSPQIMNDWSPQEQCALAFVAAGCKSDGGSQPKEVIL